MQARSSYLYEQAGFYKVIFAYQLFVGVIQYFGQHLNANVKCDTSWLCRRLLKLYYKLLQGILRRVHFSFKVKDDCFRIKIILIEIQMSY